MNAALTTLKTLWATALLQIKAPIYFIFCFSCILCSTVVSAQVYKHSDEDGNITYSDSPPLSQPDLAPAKLPPVIYQPAVIPPQKKPESAESLERLRVSISSPEQDAFILPVEQSFGVSASLNRALTDFEDITLFVNGKPHGKASKSTSWTVNNLNRGPYSLRLVVTDNNGSTITESGSTTIFVQRHIGR